MTNPNYTFTENDQIYVYTHESFKVNTKTSAGIITSGNLIPIKLSNWLKDPNDPSEFTENTRIYFIGVDNYTVVGETDSNNFPTSIANVNMIVSFADEGAEVVHEISCEWTGVINEQGFALFGFPSHRIVLSISADFSGTSSGSTPTPTPYEGSVVDGSFSTLSSLITEVMLVDADKYIIDIENDIDCALLSEYTIFDTERTSLSLDETTFTTTIDGEIVVVNHFDELADEDKSGWTPLGWSRENAEDEIVAPTQPDGTTGIIFEIKGTGDTRKTLSNFKLDLKAPWKEEGDYNNTTLGGFGTTKSKYPCSGISNTQSFINIPRVAFARHCAGYKLDNINFTNIDFKSSTRAPSLFAVNVFGDINVDGVDITGDFMAQAVTCYDMGLFFAWHNSGNTSIKNVNIDVQMRSGRWASAMIGSSYSTATSQPRFHVFENIVLNGYHNSEWWHDCDRFGGSNTDGGGATGVFIGTVRAGNNITCKNVVINADVTTYRGYWSNESGYMFGLVNGSEEFSTTITLDNVKLNGDMLWSYGSAHPQCFDGDIMNPSGKEGYGVYPYDPLDSSLSEQDKIDYRPPYVTNRRPSELNGERTERPCGWHGYYLIGHSYHYVNLNLKDFEIQGTQYYANEILDLGIIKPTYETGWPPVHHPLHFYINGEGPFYYHEPWANNNSKDGTSNVVEVSSELSDKTFRYYSPNDPTDDALNKRFNINDIKQTTSLSTSVSANSTTLQVVTNDGMSVGDKVILGQGTEKEEENEIASFGSIVLKYPLTYDHDSNTEIQIIAKSEIEVIPLTNNYNLSFDGVDGYASTELSVAGASALTVSAWVKLDSVSETRGFVTQYVVGNNRTFRLAYFPSLQSMWFEVYGPNSYAGFKDVNLLADTWYHVAGVYNGTDTVCYVNGVASTTTSGLHVSGTGNLDSCTDNIDIGRMANAEYMKGNIDEVGIWTSALSASDINSIYNEGVPNDLPHSPLAWYRMGDNDGGVGDIITDQGSGGNNATLQGSAKFYPPTPN